MPDIHVYVNRPPQKDVPGLEDLEEVLEGLEHVSEARADPSSSALCLIPSASRS